MRGRVREHLDNPPPGSKVRAAIDFGVDLSLTMRNSYELTPSERLARLEDTAASMRAMRERARQIRNA